MALFERIKRIFGFGVGATGAATIPILTVAVDTKFKSGRAGYDQIIQLGKDSLADDEYWVICEPEGYPIYSSASKDLAEPVKRVCRATKQDWDVLTDNGFSLQRQRIARHLLVVTEKKRKPKANRRRKPSTKKKKR
jgi:hypothetical protein